MRPALISRWISICLLAAGCGVWSAPVAGQQEHKFSTEQLDFFESRIRPLLVAKCLSCHGPEKSESELRLDSRAGWLAGGSQSQDWIRPGKPQDSPLLSVVDHQGDLAMPPDEPLAAQEIADLRHWIEQGLAWPSQRPQLAKLTLAERMQQDREKHWSLQPIPAADPALNSEAQVAAELDRRIRKRLESAELQLSEPADRGTLLRRLTVDLIGLPPTYQQVQEFVDNSDPQAYSQVVQRLIDSPQFGPRWARHWLDVARYADTVGYALDGVDRSYPFAYTYRDWVVDAFNQDLPYDQFILQQLAADQLTDDGSDPSLAALGFLTVGRKYLQRPDIIDDRVDVVTRGLLGLTVSCARCHDHKFDAIATEDYYSLYSVFDNCEVPQELPLIGTPPKNEAVGQYFSQLASLEQAVEDQRLAYRQAIGKQATEHLGEYALVAILPGDRGWLREQGLLTLPDPEYRGALLAKLREFWIASKHPLTITTAKELAGSEDQRRQAAQAFADQLQAVVRSWQEAERPEDPLKTLFVDGHPLAEVAPLVFGPGSPLLWRDGRADAFFNVAEDKAIRRLKAKINVHDRATPRGVDRAMIVVDRQPPSTGHVLIRGNINRPGKEVQRRFLPLLTDDPQPFQQGAGRLELAQAIVAADNPLTARVIVNRIWMHHFNSALVETPSDWGVRCAPPQHLDVLDLLARDLIDHGWSLKRLHRILVLSNVYRQSSAHRETAASVDPENRLYWRMNPRRLELEALRDSILAASGSLDLELGGRGKDQFQAPFDRRRTIYGHIDRQQLAGELRVFDLANPDQSAARRIRTQVPQQSLFLLNSELVMEQAERLAAAVAPQEGRQAQVVELFRRVLSRDPQPRELKSFTAYLEAAPAEPTSAGGLFQVAHALLMTNEFVMID